ncbi:MAG: V-type ATP synthase subunit I [Alkalispirochaeta sp.]
MKKVSVVTLKSFEEDTLRRLRDLGVLHVFTDPIDPDSADSLREQYTAVERALAAIPADIDAPGRDDAREVADEQSVVDEALDISHEIQQLLDERAQLVDEEDRIRRELERLAPWGEIDPAIITNLEDRGVRIALYEVAVEKDAEIRSTLPNPIELYRSKSLVRYLSVALASDVFPEQVVSVELPSQSTEAMRRRLDEIAGRLDAIETRLAGWNARRHILVEAMTELEKDFEFLRVGAKFDSEEELSWVTGFVPETIVDAVGNAAKEHGWGVVIRDPDPDEQVPTQINNPKPIRIIKPVFDLLGTVPGYREMDISFFFLLFFVVFFAMIIGDGGYGVILLAGTIALAAKGRAAGRRPGPGTVLMIVLSTATVVWGAVTGNWFGYAPFADLPVLRTFVIPGISIDNEASTQTIQYMTFVIGTIHLSIAHIWNFLRGLKRKPVIAAFEQLGWLSMVLGLYYLVLELVLGTVAISIVPRPDWWLTMIAGGLGVVIIFGKQEEGQNFFVGAGKGVANLITTALDGISAFSDIISYIRLFAVGLASLAIAEAFNEMALGIAGGVGGAGGAIAAVLVLFLGHTLNLAMGALSVVVHGVRLNMLEFSGHLGMEWTGVEYAPFKTR